MCDTIFLLKSLRHVRARFALCVRLCRYVQLSGFSFFDRLFRKTVLIGVFLQEAQLSILPDLFYERPGPNGKPFEMLVLTAQKPPNAALGGRDGLHPKTVHFPLLATYERIHVL